MNVTVLLEPNGNQGFRRSAAPFDFSGEGITDQEALQSLKSKIQQHLTEGAKIVSLEIPDQPNPWVEFAGMFKDDPLFAEVIEIMAENRRKMEADPNIP